MIIYSNEISITDYNMLRKSVGWLEVSQKQAETGLKNSAALIVALEDNKPVGMARTISDGSYFILIVDVIVLPSYQKKGIGTSMLREIMNSIQKNIKDNETVVTCLMSASGKEEFYQKFGFKKRPDSEQGAGMSQYIRKLENKK